MKKKFMVLLIVAIIGTLICGAFCVCATLGLGFHFSATREVMDTARAAGADTPGAGEYMVIGGGIALFADFMMLFGYILFLIVIPVMLLGMVIFFQGLAAIFQFGEPQSWKWVTGLVFTGIDMLLLVLMCANFIFLLVIGMFLDLWILGAVLVTVMLVGWLIYDIVEFVRIVKINQYNNSIQ